jgi:hypothetical protein
MNMSSPLEHLRQTGRTTRMLKHAVNLARSGKRVVIIADNRTDANRLSLELHQFITLEPGETLQSRGIKVSVPELLGADFDWEDMSVPLADDATVFLVDHHAIEDRYSKMLKMLHAYDKP